MSRARIVLVLVVVFTAALSWVVRDKLHRRVELPGRAGWVTTDPDSLYQMRRVERALDEGLAVAGSDERLGAPDGSAIPWPPYYTLFAASVLAPFAPADARERHEWLEMSVASLPLALGVLGSVLAALAARRLAGDLAALVAGSAHALCSAAVAYAKLGNGDHNAFVSLLSGALLYAFARALEPQVLDRPRAAAAWGAAMGVLAGVAMGAWVASLMYVIQAQLALGVLVAAHARRPRAGVPALGLAFHLAALGALLPAVLASPWKAAQPWMVVNLSWFHPVFLLAGACVFAPLLALRPGSRALRAWPWIVLAALALCGVALALGDFGPARALREGFEWIGRTDRFMARVGESRPLIGAGAGGAVFEALGYGVVLLPIAWSALVIRAWRDADLRLLPWAVALPLLAAEAARQARFAEALALPLAVVFGWAAAQAAGSARLRFLRRLPVPALGALALGVVALGNWPCLAKTARRWNVGADAARFERPANLGARLACQWIGAQPERAAGESVLAVWSHGHAIEWDAQRASVATNFGSYLGLDGFSAPMRFFMQEDPAAADALLERHRVRYVLVDSDLPNNLNNLIEFGAPQLRARYVAPGVERSGNVLPAFFATLGARLMFGGEVFGPLGPEVRPLGKLRLVWIAAFTDPERPLRAPNDLAPAAWVWERVSGALVEAHGTPGALFELEVRLEFGPTRRSVVWRDALHADAAGVARARVPYSTDVANGEGRALGPARWRMEGADGTLEIPERAVRDGSVLGVP